MESVRAYTRGMDVLPPSISNGAVYPWDRQESESPKAFRAFTLYKDAGSERSLTHVAQRLHVSKQAIGRWSSQHHWVARSLAWDNYQSRTINHAVLSDLVKQARQLQRVAHHALERITQGEAESLSVAELCLTLKTVCSLAECGASSNLAVAADGENGFPANLARPRFVTLRMEIVPSIDHDHYAYFRVENEAGQIEHMGQVRKDEEAYQKLLERHPDAIIVR
jgi:hypothetical protein